MLNNQRGSMGVAIGLIAGLLVLGFALCFRTIGVGQVGVVISFGHISRVASSGVLVKAPWPFQELHKYDIKVQKDEAEAAAASADLQDVDVKLVTNYHIDGAKVATLFSQVGDDYKSRIIDPAITESVKANTSKFPVADLITKRPQLKAAIVSTLRTRLEHYGIYVDDVSITNLGFSKQFTQAIEAKQVAQQQAEQAKYDAEKAANQAQAKIETAKGEAEAQRLVQQTLTPELLQKIAIERWDGKMPATVAGSAGVLNLLLGK